jgi:hypothetical protein
LDLIPFMPDLIRPGWLRIPHDRPSFDEILSDLQDKRFGILPNAASADMEDFCEAILEWERRAGVSH